jgi:hypothetical protein
MRKHLTYANVAATLALVFAMSGGALAAKHYLINSTKQINPKVLKKLRGNTGPRGATGAAGAQGKEGAAGKQGAEGKAAPVPETFSSSAASVAFAPGKAAEVITEVTLPAGTYTVLASTTAENNSAAPDEAGCVLLDNTDAFDGQKVTANAKEASLIALPAVLLTVTAPSETVNLACKSENTAEGNFRSARLIAKKETAAG